MSETRTQMTWKKEGRTIKEEKMRKRNAVALIMGYFLSVKTLTTRASFSTRFAKVQAPAQDSVIYEMHAQHRQVEIRLDCVDTNIILNWLVVNEFCFVIQHDHEDFETI
ncbi:hypothetical protein IRJ41_021584 [Triplophysa rosa]|uniref:Uncharacterized protein n=1 Tax=Triplophysa rosa TaxID=992332 RepID=A0A9W8C898_TRIRA|nr:hypothetical protein IRJ41_021584 [Triplophysa rosa]